MTGTYLFTGVVLGALSTNLWEEAAWGGFVQDRLMRRHGPLAGSLLIAVPFVLIHVPGAFQNTSPGVAVVDIAAIAVLAPFLRYLIGMVLLDTAGSVLAVGLMHASFNASGRLSAAHGGWQFLPALAALTVLVAGYRSMQEREVVHTRHWRLTGTVNFRRGLKTFF
jgi:membrane protease YdiL (CAAX protease family)